MPSPDSDPDTDLTLEELKRKAADLERAEHDYEQFLLNEPKRIAAEAAERAATLPPPDDFADRRRERRFYELACRGQIRNERRAQAGSTLLFLLLIAATSGLVMWVLRLAT